MSIYNWLVALICSVFGIAAFAQSLQDGGHQIEEKRILVLDAGSSGARIMQYRLIRDTDTKEKPLYDLISQSAMIEVPPLKLNTPLDYKVASFINKITRANEGTGQTLSFFLGATAGLRAMNGLDAKKILIQKAEQISSFGIPAEFNNNVRLLTGLEEGVYAWFGVNTILRSGSPQMSFADTLNVMARQHPSQYGVIEIGGGSVQVGFSIPFTFEHQQLRRDQSDNRPSDIPNVKRLYLPNDLTLDVYSKSLWQSGLNATYTLFTEQYLEYPASNPCLNWGIAVEDEITGEKQFAYGNYQRCREAIAHLLFSQPQAAFNGVTVVDTKYRDKLPKKFFLTGYFYDKTTAKGLPEKFNLTLLDEAAEHVCNMDYLNLFFLDFRKQIFSTLIRKKTYSRLMYLASIFTAWKGGVPRTGDLGKYCTHLTYISQLLRKIGITSDHELFTRKHLFYQGDSYSVSWPLGYAILSANNWL